MKFFPSAILLATIATCWSSEQVATAADWIFAPSYFTHDPQSGQRVSQYAEKDPAYAPERGNYRRSGYRHTQNVIRAGGSADRYHLVEEWGRPVRPYGEWQRPYRPYSVPYRQWGVPYGGLESYFQFNQFGGRRGNRGRFDYGYGPALPPGYGPGPPDREPVEVEL